VIPINNITDTASPRTGPALVGALAIFDESTAPKLTNLSSRNTMSPSGNVLNSKGTLKSKLTLKKKETYAKTQTLTNDQED